MEQVDPEMRAALLALNIDSKKIQVEKSLVRGEFYCRRFLKRAGNA